MLTRDEQVRLDELCLIHGIGGETDYERYGRLALVMSEKVPDRRRRRRKWNGERLSILLQLFERQVEQNRSQPVTRDGVEGWHLGHRDPEKVAIGQLKKLYPNMFGEFSDKTLANKISEARLLRRA